MRVDRLCPKSDSERSNTGSAGALARTLRAKHTQVSWEMRSIRTDRHCGRGRPRSQLSGLCFQCPRTFGQSRNDRVLLTQQCARTSPLVQLRWRGPCLRGFGLVLLGFRGISEPVRDDLAAVNGDLAAVNGDLAAVNGDLAAVNGDLAGVNGDLAAVNGDLAAVNGHLAGVNGDLAAVNGHLAAVNGDLAGVNGDLAVVNGQLAGVNGHLAGGCPRRSYVCKLRPEFRTSRAARSRCLCHRVPGRDPRESGMHPERSAPA